jgi:hypothetical protein
MEIIASVSQAMVNEASLLRNVMLLSACSREVIMTAANSPASKPARQRDWRARTYPVDIARSVAMGNDQRCRHWRRAAAARLPIGGVHP